ncbi:hypothetical protein RKD05_003381 [Microbacterium sp. SLBN-111]
MSLSVPPSTGGLGLDLRAGQDVAVAALLEHDLAVARGQAVVVGEFEPREGLPVATHETEEVSADGAVGVHAAGLRWEGEERQAEVGEGAVLLGRHVARDDRVTGSRIGGHGIRHDLLDRGGVLPEDAGDLRRDVGPRLGGRGRAVVVAVGEPLRGEHRVDLHVVAVHAGCQRHPVLVDDRAAGAVFDPRILQTHRQRLVHVLAGAHDLDVDQPDDEGDEDDEHEGQRHHGAPSGGTGKRRRLRRGHVLIVSQGSADRR